MYFHCAFSHTILTVAQNTQRGNFTIIPECYNVYLVVFPICASPDVCFEQPKSNNTKSVHPIGLSMLKLFFCSKLYSGNKYTETVSSFGFIL